MSFTKVSFVTLLAMALSAGASAALFDTIESVETIQKVAAAQAQKSDRMPASTKTDDTQNGAKTDGTQQPKSTTETQQ